MSCSSSCTRALQRRQKDHSRSDSRMFTTAKCSLLHGLCCSVRAAPAGQERGAQQGSKMLHILKQCDRDASCSCTLALFEHCGRLDNLQLTRCGLCKPRNITSQLGGGGVQTMAPHAAHTPVLSDHLGMQRQQACSHRPALASGQLFDCSVHCARPQRRKRHRAVVHAEQQKQKEEPGLGLKAAWAAAEQYGNLVGGKKDGASAAAPKVHLGHIPQPCMF